LTEPSKINQNAVLFSAGFKLNKAEGFEVLYFTLGQIAVMNFCRTRGVFFFGCMVLLLGCTNRDKVANKMNYDRLYFDYTITGEEGDENITCMFQYKDGDAEGKALGVEPAKVKLDGEVIGPDSARLSGFFYEIQKPVDSFAGKHSVVFITPDKQYKNGFEFFPFTLQEELPERISRQRLTIPLRNFPPGERSVRLLLLDTAFESMGFNDMVPVVNGKVTVDEFILKNVKNGPINLELYLEQEVPLQEPTKAGGKISITYGLKREFELMD